MFNDQWQSNGQTTWNKLLTWYLLIRVIAGVVKRNAAAEFYGRLERADARREPVSDDSSRPEIYENVHRRHRVSYLE